MHTQQEQEWHFSGDNLIIARGEGKRQRRGGEVGKRKRAGTLIERD